jgi:hypothetical protein
MAQLVLYEWISAYSMGAYTQIPEPDIHISNKRISSRYNNPTNDM